ncbi:hypothetical protein BR93DRAFT_134420 [Coniochaeta sp. PMI_546]|nr:hypothetical protein BR93DRAFT_134420 [Coniochaeta sp. PMI_546]
MTHRAFQVLVRSSPFPPLDEQFMTCTSFSDPSFGRNQFNYRTTYLRTNRAHTSNVKIECVFISGNRIALDLGSSLSLVQAKKLASGSSCVVSRFMRVRTTQPISASFSRYLVRNIRRRSLGERSRFLREPLGEGITTLVHLPFPGHRIGARFTVS